MPRHYESAGDRVVLLARASSCLWVTTGAVFVAGQAAAALVIRRYGQWVFVTPQDRFSLHAFSAVAAVLTGVGFGLILWVWLRVVDRAAQRVKPPWLVFGAIATTAAWVLAMLASAPLTVFTNEYWVCVVVGGFSLIAAAARGRRSWLLADVAFLLGAAASVLTLLAWLNLVYIRQAISIRSSILNVLALFGAGVVIAAGLFLMPTASAQPSTLVPARRRGTFTAATLTLCGLVFVSGLAFVPVYRLAVAAGQVVPLTASFSFRGDDSGSVHRFDGTASARHCDNLILISIDTLRADHLGIYGYGRTTTPNIDSFFAAGARFTNSFSQTPWTLPSHVSMLTGQYPSTHGVRIHPTITRGYVDPISSEATTLAEMASAAGLHTAGFTGGGFLTLEYGFGQGFAAFGEASSKRLHEVLEMALPWLRTVRRQRFFLFLHGFDCHRYNPSCLYPGIDDGGYGGPLRIIREKRPEAMENLVVGDGFYSLSDQDVAFLRFLYDSEIRHTDDELGLLFAELARLDLLERTAVILTSDHGESFYEHRATGHSFDLYDSAVRVPLLIRAPRGMGPAVIHQRAQTVDIAPTVVELLGLAVPDGANLQGRSLVQALVGGTLSEQPVICEADALDTQASLMVGRFKYINYGILSHNLLDRRLSVLSVKGLFSPYSRGEELFDHERDPLEQRNLVADLPQLTATLREHLRGALLTLRAADRLGSVEGMGNEMSPEIEEQLRSLGYFD